MGTTITGGCACGAIRYEIAAEPVIAVHCQCRACQRDSGTGHASLIAFPGDAVTITGTPKFYDSRADSGNMVSRGFCETCGSPVVSKNDGMPNMLAFRAASLDDPSIFNPAFVVFAEKGHVWDRLDASLHRFPRMPEQVPEF